MWFKSVLLLYAYALSKPHHFQRTSSSCTWTVSARCSRKRRARGTSDASRSPAWTCSSPPPRRSSSRAPPAPSGTRRWRSRRVARAASSSFAPSRSSRPDRDHQDHPARLELLPQCSPLLVLIPRALDLTTYIYFLCVFITHPLRTTLWPV